MYCYSMTYYALTDKLSPSCARAGIDEVLSLQWKGSSHASQRRSWAPTFCRRSHLSAKPGGVFAIARARADATRRGIASGFEWPSPPALEDMGMREELVDVSASR